MASSIEITAPDSAEEGVTLPVSVRVANISEYHYSFRTKIYKVPDLYPSELIFSKDETISSGSSRDYPAPFTMPDCNTTILVWVERWSFDHWEYDNSASKIVSVVVAPPPPPCSISISAPGSAQEGEKVSLSATITNNSPSAQLYKTEMYAGTEFIGSIEDTIPGYSSRTYGGSFIMPARDVTILIWVEVWRVDHWDYNNSASKDVTLYVPPPPPPEFSGTISRKELEYDHVRSSIPVY